MILHWLSIAGYTFYVFTHEHPIDQSQLILVGLVFLFSSCCAFSSLAYEFPFLFFLFFTLCFSYFWGFLFLITQNKGIISFVSMYTVMLISIRISVMIQRDFTFFILLIYIVCAIIIASFFLKEYFLLLEYFFYQFFILLICFTYIYLQLI